MATKTLNDLLADWGAARAEMEHYVTRLPDVLGTEAVKVCQDNFRLQGYDDGHSIVRWPKRSPETNRRYNLRKGVKGTVYNAANKILEQSGVLRDGIGFKKQGAGEVFVGVDDHLIPYAKIHNEALTGLAWGKHPFKMPLRKYMPTQAEGPNAKMIKAFDKKTSADIARILKKFKDPDK